MLGVGAAKEDQWSRILPGLAGAFAGACSMAAVEFVSVSTQRDIERAILEQYGSNPEPEVEKGGGDIVLEIVTNAHRIVKANMSLPPEVTPSRFISGRDITLVIRYDKLTPAGRNYPRMAARGNTLQGA